MTFGIILQKPKKIFYQTLAVELEAATAAQSDIRGSTLIRFVEELSPGAIIEQMRVLAQSADALCIVAPLLGETLLDPQGDGRHGYWYWSDGLSFTLFALFEQPLASDDQCTQVGVPAFAGRDDLYCLRQGSED